MQCLTCIHYHPERRERPCTILIRGALPGEDDHCGARIEASADTMRIRAIQAEWRDFFDRRPGGHRGLPENLV